MEQEIQDDPCDDVSKNVTAWIKCTLEPKPTNQKDHIMEYIECIQCDGVGYLWNDVPVPMSMSVSSGFIDSEWVECDECNGTGSVEKEEEDE